MKTMQGQEVVQQIAGKCKRLEQTVSLAESCTGGLAAAMIAAQPGVSQFFVGAVVSYTATVKRNMLGVPDYSLRTMGEVSQNVALWMARGAQQRLGSQWAVALTGIAGPSGGSPDKPVGTVCFALIGPGVEKTEKQLFDSQLSRQQIQEQAALHVLHLLAQALPGSSP